MLTKSKASENRDSIKNFEWNTSRSRSKDKKAHEQNDKEEDINFHIIMEVKTTSNISNNKDKMLEDIQIKLLAPIH